MDDVLQGLLKKDPDLEVVEHTEDTLVVESQIFDDTPDTVPKTDESIFAKETSSPMVHVTVRMIRFVHITNAAYTFLVLCWGLLVSIVLEYDVSWTGLVASFCIFSSLTFATFVVMYFVMDPFYGIPLVGLWMFLLFMSLNALAAFLHNMAVFQGVGIVLFQSLSLLLYGARSPRGLKLVTCFTVMCVAGMIPWLCGLYAFIRNKDWITALVLFFFGVIGASAYTTYQVSLVDRFNTSRKDRVRALIHYYTDVLFGPLRWIRDMWMRYRPTPDEEEEADL